jgi:hypothetical protein
MMRGSENWASYVSLEGVGIKVFGDYMSRHSSSFAPLTILGAGLSRFFHVD